MAKKKKIIISIVVIMIISIAGIITYTFGHRYVNHEEQIERLAQEFEMDTVEDREELERLFKVRENIKKDGSEEDMCFISWKHYLPIYIVAIPFVIYLLVMLINFIRETAYNNSQPKLTVDAKVLTKRMKSNNNRYQEFQYYATFGFESGDRIEVKMSGNDYGMIVEGDIGKLTFQGKKFYEFKRN